MKIFQKGFNYSQDGDGNRLVYHLQGCNMKCPWCANPEGMKKEGVIIADEEWLLESICPHHAISGKKIDRNICKSCSEKECITKHSTKGMYLSYEEQTVKEILEEAKNNAMMFYDGGGVTFTGGEATVQFAELKEALTRLKEAGIHTALETNGAHPKLEELFPYIDQLIMDCKVCDSTKHKEYTGLSCDIVFDNIRKAAKYHPNLHIRVPLIGGVNDSAADQEAFLSFFQQIKGDHVTFEVLAYHEFGKKKWEECGWEYKMTEKAKVDEENLKNFRRKIAEAGCTYKRT